TRKLMDASSHRAAFVTIRRLMAELQLTRVRSGSASVMHNTARANASVAPIVITTLRACHKSDRSALLGRSNISPTATTPARLVIMASDPSAAIWISKTAGDVTRDSPLEWDGNLCRQVKVRMDASNK